MIEISEHHSNKKQNQIFNLFPTPDTFFVENKKNGRKLQFEYILKQ